MLQKFKKYVKTLDDKTITKHNIYSVDKKTISEVEKHVTIPNELKKLYEELGYGFFHRDIGASFKLLSPDEYQQINLKEDFYEFDPSLEIYEEIYSGNKFLFFEVVEGSYLAIDKDDINGKNAIYYFNDRIADSLEEFLIKFDENGVYFDTPQN